MTKYNEVMERITLSQDDKNRIADKVADAVSEIPGRRKPDLAKAGKLIAFAACLVLIISGTIKAADPDFLYELSGRVGESSPDSAAISGENDYGSDTEGEDRMENSVSEKNSAQSSGSMGADSAILDLIEVNGIEELEKISGFEIKEPLDGDIQRKNGVSETKYLVYGSRGGGAQLIAEVLYLDEKGEMAAYYRKAEGSEDISGDYNIYENEITSEFGENREVLLKGEENVYRLAIWSSSGYTYSLYLKNGMKEEEWKKILDNTSDK